ncbi:MAG: hypothetical protein EBT93_07550, partial [Alphaproteobacteria bacterium]|nr:hypothetical protein [Alphaproteobacteria bacterium]
MMNGQAGQGDQEDQEDQGNSRLSSTGAKWLLSQPPLQYIEGLIEATSMPRPLAAMLASRDITKDKIKLWIDPKMRDLMVKKSNLTSHSNGLNNLNFELASKNEATESAKRELDKQVNRISMRTAKGQRNVTLNESAFIMGQYIGGGQISVPEVVEALTKAARIAYRGQNAEAEIASVLRLTGGALSAGSNSPIYDIEFENLETLEVEN